VKKRVRGTAHLADDIIKEECKRNPDRVGKRTEKTSNVKNSMPHEYSRGGNEQNIQQVIELGRGGK